MNIYVFGFDHAYAGLMVGIMDVFDQAGKLLANRRGTVDAEKVHVKLASVDGKPILCQNNLLLNVHCAVEDIRQADILIITAIHDVDAALSKHRFMVDWLRACHGRGTALASICTAKAASAHCDVASSRSTARTNPPT